MAVITALIVGNDRLKIGAIPRWLLLAVFLQFGFAANGYSVDMMVKKIHAEAVSETHERVCIQLSNYFMPALQGLEGQKPRVYLDIQKVSKWDGPRVMHFNGSMILRVRTHFDRKSQNLRIVLDLEPHGDYFVGQTYVESGNIFCISVSPDQGQKQ